MTPVESIKSQNTVEVTLLSHSARKFKVGRILPISYKGLNRGLRTVSG